MVKEEREKGRKVKKGYNRVIIDGIEWRKNKSKGKLDIAKPKN